MDSGEAGVPWKRKGKGGPCGPGDFPFLVSDPRQLVLRVTSFSFKVSQMSVFSRVPFVEEAPAYPPALSPSALHPGTQRTSPCWNWEPSLLPSCLWAPALVFPQLDRLSSSCSRPHVLPPRLQVTPTSLFVP